MSNMHQTWGSDLEECVRRYNSGNESPLASEFSEPPGVQKKNWPKILHGDFGANHVNTPCLPKEYGFDGEPLFSSNRPRNHRTYYQNHVFVPPPDAFRSALFFLGPDIIGISQQVIKCEWEDYFARKCKGWRSGKFEVGEIWRKITENEVKDSDRKFNKDPDQKHSTAAGLWGLLEEPWHLLSSAGYDRKSFAVLLERIKAEGIHHVSVFSKELDSFRQRWKETFSSLVEAGANVRERFWAANLEWVQAQDALDEVLLDVENAKLSNSNVKRAWFEEFGKEEVLLLEANRRLALAAMMLSELLNNPDITDDELDELTAVRLEQWDQDIQDARQWEQMAPHLKKMNNGTWETLSDGDAVRHSEREQCKKLIRQIFRMTHPDRLMHHPNYADLSQVQKDELASMFIACLDVPSEDIGLPPSHLNHDMRSTHGLFQAIARVKEILKTAGIEVDTTYVIPPGTVKEQLAWVEAELKRLDDAILVARASWDTILCAPEVQRWREILASSDCWKEIHGRLGETIREVLSDAEAKEKELEMHRGNK